MSITNRGFIKCSVQIVPALVNRHIFFLFVTLLSISVPAPAIEVVDDIGRHISVDKPAQRIISLAPHITENLFAAGAGKLIVGAVAYSDYPEAAKTIPQLGGYNNFDNELILSLRPDLVIAWKQGNQKQQVDRLVELGLTVYINAPAKLGDIAENIRQFGILAGTEAVAVRASNRFLNRLAQLRGKYSGKTEISVFYETWHKPLLTVNQQQFIGRVIHLCSGRNIFADLHALTPQVSLEAVLAQDPRVIIASGMGKARPEWLNDWRRWPFLNAVKHDSLLFIPPDIIQRHTPRVLDGARLICQYLQKIRALEF